MARPRLIFEYDRRLVGIDTKITGPSRHAGIRPLPPHQALLAGDPGLPVSPIPGARSYAGPALSVTSRAPVLTVTGSVPKRLGVARLGDCCLERGSPDLVHMQLFSANFVE